MADQPPEESRETTFGQAAASAAAAMFGVQSSKNRDKDFKARSPAKFIFMGMVMVMLFVTCVLLAVRCSMQQAGVAG
ncbi:MAG: DUF2970 domain-containing protein [Pseudomonadota bacterium]